MAKKVGAVASKSKASRVVSFRIADSLYAVLEKHAQGERDEMGADLTASGFARKLLIRAIDELEKPKR